MPSGDREEVEGMTEGGLARAKLFLWNPATGAWQRMPGVLHDEVDSGPSLKIGGRADTTRTGQTAVADGDKVDGLFDASGKLGIFLGEHSSDGGGNIARILTDGDASATLATLGVLSRSNRFNGTNYDRERNNVEATVLASAARTATLNSADQVNYDARGVRIFLDISAVSGTSPTLDVKLQSKDALSGVYVDDPGSVFAQKTATGTDELTVYPGVTTSANRARSAPLPRTWRVVCTIGGTTPSFTFSVGASYIK